jgi:hypothetical protein
MTRDAACVLLCTASDRRLGTGGVTVLNPQKKVRIQLTPRPLNSTFIIIITWALRIFCTLKHEVYVNNI